VPAAYFDTLAKIPFFLNLTSTDVFPALALGVGQGKNVTVMQNALPKGFQGKKT